MRLICLLLVLVAWCAGPAFAVDPIAPGGRLRAVFLGGNPAQAAVDPKTGAMVGPAAALVVALGRHLGVETELRPIAGPPLVVGEVASGNADIGFLAYEPSRVGVVEFSQTYALVQQTFIVRDDSPIRSVADADLAGQRIAGTANDSITLYMRRTFRHANVLAVENEPEANKRRLLAGEFDAFSGNRHRMTIWARELPGTRVLPDTLFDVPQAIIVAKGRPDVLAAINAFIDRARASGVIGNAIAAAGLIGVEVAPVGYRPKLAE